MHPLFEKYFALEDDIRKGIKSGTDDKGKSFGNAHLNNCLPCYAEGGWDEKLGEILKRHGIDLVSFSQEKFASFGSNLFIVEEGKLKWNRSLGSCLDLQTVLHVAGKYL